MKKILIPIFVFILVACSSNTPAPTLTAIPLTPSATVIATLTSELAPGLTKNGDNFTLVVDGKEVTLGYKDIIFDNEGKWQGVKGYELKDGNWVATDVSTEFDPKTMDRPLQIISTDPVENVEAKDGAVVNGALW